MIGRLCLYWETARHLSLRQIVTRLSRMAERYWWRVSRANAPTPRAPTPVSQPSIWRDLTDDPVAVARGLDIIEGRFTFLSETKAHPSWDAPDVSRLWRFHLHSFDYLRDLAALHRAGKSVEAYEGFRALVRSWMESHSRLGGDAWHPYTVSMRVVNWCEAAEHFRETLDPEFARRLYDSIYGQTAFLARHLEHDVRGNHLLENARALIRSGAFFGERTWIEQGATLLKNELTEQVLADGGHFERTPGYHLRVMNILRDVSLYLREEWLEDARTRMQAYYDAIVPLSGRLPLFKDTVLPERPIVPTQPRESRWLEASGYAVMRDDTRNDFLIADFGSVCPDYLPAHAHADMFSFELTMGGRPVVTDSGVFEYEAGEWRQRFRSTASHNTVEIDGRDQSEMWGSFRAGKRARVREVAWHDDDGFLSIEGEHDGYEPLRHRRWIVSIRAVSVWVVVDRLVGPNNHAARSFLHFHPSVGDFHLVPLGSQRVDETQSWYSEAFGKKDLRRCVVLSATTPATFGYILSGDALARSAMRAEGEGCVVSFETATLRATLRLAPRSCPILDVERL